MPGRACDSRTDAPPTAGEMKIIRFGQGGRAIIAVIINLWLAEDGEF